MFQIRFIYIRIKTKKAEPNPRQSEKADPDPRQEKIRIRNNVVLFRNQRDGRRPGLNTYSRCLFRISITFENVFFKVLLGVEPLGNILRIDNVGGVKTDLSAKRKTILLCI